MPKEGKLSVREDTREMSPITPVKNLDIKGLEDVPISALPLPMVKLVHPTTKNAMDRTGNRVAPGTFLNTQSGKTYEQFEFYIVRSRPGIARRKDPKTGETEERPAFMVLGAEKDTMELFIMQITGSSFWQFRQLLGTIKGTKTAEVWRYLITATSEQREGDYGLYFYSQFSLGPEVNESDLNILEGLYQAYGSALDLPADADKAQDETGEEIAEAADKGIGEEDAVKPKQTEEKGEPIPF